MRDSLLVATGELNRASGWFPGDAGDQHGGGIAATHDSVLSLAGLPAFTHADERNRRTIYAYRVRGQADPFLELFNQPNPNDSCEERDSAAVTPQAFTLLNSQVMSDRAIALALRA